MSATHFDFDQAPPGMQWISSLERLRELLENEARELIPADTPLPRHSDGPWASRVLPKGAWCGMRLRRDGKLELGIHRNSRPQTDAKLDAWQSEIRTFLKFFGCEQWAPIDPPRIKYGVSAHFLEVKPEPPPLELEL